VDGCSICDRRRHGTVAPIAHAIRRQFTHNRLGSGRRVIHNAAAPATGGPLRGIMDNVGNGISAGQKSRRLFQTDPLPFILLCFGIPTIGFCALILIAWATD
jgi:hypothetical protein